MQIKLPQSTTHVDDSAIPTWSPMDVAPGVRSSVADRNVEVGEGSVPEAEPSRATASNSALLDQIKSLVEEAIDRKLDALSNTLLTSIAGVQSGLAKVESEMGKVKSEVKELKRSHNALAPTQSTGSARATGCPSKRPRT